MQRIFYNISPTRCVIVAPKRLEHFLLIVLNLVSNEMLTAKKYYAMCKNNFQANFKFVRNNI